MKHTTIKKLAGAGVLLFTLALTGCKKDKIDDPTPDSSVIQQLSGDEETFESALDESMNDVDMYLSNGNLKSTEMHLCSS